MQFENEVRQHKCPLCDKSYKKKSTLKNHLSAHSGIRSHICHVCGKGFTTKDYLTTHVKFHTAKKRFQCPICPHTFATKGNFRRHTQRHQGEKNYFCRVCHKGFTTDSNLLVHMKTHSSERPHVCSICSKDFLFRGALQRHLDNVHLAERLNVCSVFGIGGFLVVKKREESSEKPFSCKVCEKHFDCKVTFKRHLHSHEGKKTYTCGICSRYFENYVDLEWHLRSHLGMEPYVCTICNKKFLENYRLTKHLKIHEREDQEGQNNEDSTSGEYSDVSDIANPSFRPFKCAHCGKEFRSKNLLNQHLKNHYDERPFACNVCGLGFIYKSKLKAHMKAHAKVPSALGLDQREDIEEFKTVLLKEEKEDEYEFDSFEEHPLKVEIISDCDEVTSMNSENNEGNVRDIEETVTDKSNYSHAVIKKEHNLENSKGNTGYVCDGEFVAVFSGNDLIENLSDEDPCSHNDDNAVDPLA